MVRFHKKSCISDVLMYFCAVVYRGRVVCTYMSSDLLEFNEFVSSYGCLPVDIEVYKYRYSL